MFSHGEFGNLDQQNPNGPLCITYIYLDKQKIVTFVSLNNTYSYVLQRAIGSMYPQWGKIITKITFVF